MNDSPKTVRNAVRTRISPHTWIVSDGWTTRTRRILPVIIASGPAGSPYLRRTPQLDEGTLPASAAAPAATTAGRRRRRRIGPPEPSGLG